MISKLEFSPRFASLLLIGCVWLSGCVHVGETLGLIPKKPKISFADFNVSKASLASINTEIDMKVLNQDAKDLKIQNINFDLIFTGDIVGSGTLAQAINIKPNEEQTVKFPVSLKTAQLFGAALELLKGSSKDKLEIRGTASVATWLGTIDVPFDHKLSK